MAAASLAACGGTTGNSQAVKAPPKTPQAQLKDGVSSLGSSSSLSVDLHLNTTAAQLHTLAPTIPTPFDGVITGASLVLKESTGNGQSLASLNKQGAHGSTAQQTAALEDVNTDFTVGSQGTTYFELRTVKGVLYAQANVSAALGLAGKGAMLKSLEAQIPASNEYDFARAALQGHWVSVNYVPLLKTIESSTSSSYSAAQGQALIGDIEAALLKNVTVANAGKGPGGSSKLAIGADENNLVNSLVSTFVKDYPAAANTPLPPGISTLPHKTFTADGFVKGTTLTGVQLNLSQFAPTTSAPLVFAADFGHPQVSISAPSGAVAVPPNLVQALLSTALSSAQAKVG